jgi:hypothetical protein
MPHDIMSALCQRYLAGELSLETAGSRLYELMRTERTGLSIDLIHVDPANHQRAMALLGYTIWRSREEMGPANPQPVSEADFAAIVERSPEREQVPGDSTLGTALVARWPVGTA